MGNECPLKKQEMQMRLILATLFLAFFAVPATALVAEDITSIESSHAGLEERQQEKFIIPLALSEDVEKDIEETREGCTNFRPVLDKVESLYKAGKNPAYEIHSLVDKAGMSPLCVVYVESFWQDGSAKSVLLTPEGDQVIMLRPDEAYTSWEEIDHLEYAFDYVQVDDYSAYGIYPAGEVAETHSLVPLVKYKPVIK